MIVIKGMKMPESCNECPIQKVEEFEYDDDGWIEYEYCEICPLIGDYIQDDKDPRCPLQEVVNTAPSQITD